MGGVLFTLPDDQRCLSGSIFSINFIGSDCFVAFAIVRDNNGVDKTPAYFHSIGGNHEV